MDIVFADGNEGNETWILSGVEAQHTTQSLLLRARHSFLQLLGVLVAEGSQSNPSPGIAQCQRELPRPKLDALPGSACSQ